jgi:glucans biosynthesis protein C
MSSQASALPVGPLTPGSTKSGAGLTLRTSYVDHLRVVLTILVVLHHVAIVYGGSGGWYSREVPNGSVLPLVWFNTVNQSFFMGLFFLLAGFFTPGSFERKGPRQFLGERLMRLGLPLVVYTLLLSPLTIAIALMQEGRPFLSTFVQVVGDRHFEPGPLWFALALLIFALGYLGWRRSTSRRWNLKGPPSHAVLLAAAGGVALVAFLIRLWMPVGESIFGLQIGYFPAYTLLFVIGCASASSRWFERLDARQVAPWTLMAFLLVLLLPLIIAWRGIDGGFEGGANLNAVFYATWDPLVGWGITLTLLYVFHRYANGHSPAMTWLSRRAYGMYILHPPVVVGVTLALHSWSAPALLKFGVAGLFASAGSALAASLLLLLPGARRIL